MDEIFYATMKTMAGIKRKSEIAADGGTGYGGRPDDTKKLLMGRKKAEKASAKDDKANVGYLRQMNSWLQENAIEWQSGLDEDGRKELSKILADTFRNQVPTDWDQRKDLYNIALEVCRTLTTMPSLGGTIFGQKDEPDAVLYWLLDFRQQAKDILNRHLESGWTAEDERDVSLATLVDDVANAALEMSKRCGASKPVADLSVISLSERYQTKLGPLRFDTVDSMQTHYFLQKTPTAPVTLDTRRLFKELTSYRTALPIEYGSSCFCRVISSRLDMVRIMITGPDETPYANGCFFFDIMIPPTYPQVSPKVQFLTTGGGAVRFNPNLYNCGKVCLSLLGTWAGPGWVSGQSSLLQVLISIQSLILVPDPYYNEPAWEVSRGTERGTAQSKAYNKSIRSHTLSVAIESHLTSILADKNQYVEFESAMIAHFLEKRSLIQKEIWSWVTDDAKLAPTVAKISSLLEQLSNRERGLARAKKAPKLVDLTAEIQDINFASIPAVAKKPTETINLYDSEEDENIDNQTRTPSSNGPIKSEEVIEID